MTREMSPAIEPVRYDRGREGYDDVRPVEYTFDRFDASAIDEDNRTVYVSSDWILHHGDLGDVWIGRGHAHVPEPVYRTHNMIMLREYMYAVLSSLAEVSIVVGWSEV